MSDLELWLTILGMAAVTFAVRYPPLVLVGRLNMPPRLLEALRYVPIAVLSAIIAPAVLMPDGEMLFISLENARLVAGLASALVMLWTKNLLWTILAGMALFVLLQAL